MLRESTSRWPTDKVDPSLESIAFEVPGPTPAQRGMLEATFDRCRRLGEWDLPVDGACRAVRRAGPRSRACARAERTSQRTSRTETAPGWRRAAHRLDAGHGRSARLNRTRRPHRLHGLAQRHRGRAQVCVEGHYRRRHRALIAKLTDAKEALARGNLEAARRKLLDSINQCAASSGSSVSPAAADVLMTDARWVLQNL